MSIFGLVPDGSRLQIVRVCGDPARGGVQVDGIGAVRSRDRQADTRWIRSCGAVAVKSRITSLQGLRRGRESDLRIRALRLSAVGAVGGDCDGGENADDGNHRQQLEQSNTTLFIHAFS